MCVHSEKIYCWRRSDPLVKRLLVPLVTALQVLLSFIYSIFKNLNKYMAFQPTILYFLNSKLPSLVKVHIPRLETRKFTCLDHPNPKRLHLQWRVSALLFLHVPMKTDLSSKEAWKYTQMRGSGPLSRNLSR